MSGNMTPFLQVETFRMSDWTVHVLGIDKRKEVKSSIMDMKEYGNKTSVCRRLNRLEINTVGFYKQR